MGTLHFTAFVRGCLCAGHSDFIFRSLCRRRRVSLAAATERYAFLFISPNLKP